MPRKKSKRNKKTRAGNVQGPYTYANQPSTSTVYRPISFQQSRAQISSVIRDEQARRITCTYTEVNETRTVYVPDDFPTTHAERPSVHPPMASEPAQPRSINNKKRTRGHRSARSQMPSWTATDQSRDSGWQNNQIMNHQPNRTNSESHTEFSCICAGIFIQALFLAISIAMLVIGSINFDKCPVEHRIPIFMVVFGIFGFLNTPLCCVLCCSDGNSNSRICLTIIEILVVLFIVAWFITGSYWVYHVYPPDYHFMKNNYCEKSLYLFAFSFVTICYSLVGLVLAWVFCARGK